MPYSILVMLPATTVKANAFVMALDYCRVVKIRLVSKLQLGKLCENHECPFVLSIPQVLTVVFKW
jgi:hypothetical protein